MLRWTLGYTCLFQFWFPWCVYPATLDAWGWSPGTTQRDGTGREEGGGFTMGNTCISVADTCWCMAKPIQYCKIISLQLKKINLYLKKEMKRIQAQNVDLLKITVKELPEPLGVYPHCQPPLPISVPLFAMETSIKVWRRNEKFGLIKQPMWNEAAPCVGMIWV